MNISGAQAICLDIAASDFDSPKDLANFLKQLMQDKDEYRRFVTSLFVHLSKHLFRYFNWAKLYRKSRITEEEIKVSCQLCKLAHKQPKHRIENYKVRIARQTPVRRTMFVFRSTGVVKNAFVITVPIS